MCGISRRNSFKGGECETPRKSNFLKNGKMVISIKIHNFSRSRMTKQTSPLDSSNSETVGTSCFSRHVEECGTLGTL